MKRSQWLVNSIVMLSSGLFSAGALAYCLTGGPGCPQTATGWPGGTASFGSKGWVGSSAAYDKAFASAASDWNHLTLFAMNTSPVSYDPCGLEGHFPPQSKSGWKFGSALCDGETFGESVLAAAVYWRESGTQALIDADIVI